MGRLIFLLFLLLSFNAFSQGESCVPLLDGFPISLKDQSFDYFTHENYCDENEFLKSPCKCFKQRSRSEQSNIKEAMKEIKKEHIKKISEEYRQKKGEEYLAKFNHIVQKTLFLDQLYAVGAIKEGMLNKTPSCSMGGLTSKIKNLIPSKCQSSLEQSFKKYLKMNGIKSIDDFAKRMDSDTQNLINYKKHKPNSCLPYREYLNIQMVNQHLNDFALDGTLYSNENYLAKFKRSGYNNITQQFIDQYKQWGNDGLVTEVGYQFYTYAQKTKFSSINPFLKAIESNQELRAKLEEFMDQDEVHMGAYDFIYKNEQALSIVLEDMNKECESLLSGEALSAILCEEGPDIPFDEMVNLKSFDKLKRDMENDYSIENTDLTPLAVAVEMQCKTLNRGKRKKPFNSPSTILDTIDLDKGAEANDLLATSTPKNAKFEKLSSYEQVDQMTCEIFPECQGEQLDPKCSDPSYMYMQVASKFTKEFAPFGSDFRETGKAPIKTICDSGREGELGFYKKINPERIIHYCSLYRYFDKAFNNHSQESGSLATGDNPEFIRSFNNITRERSNLSSCDVEMMQGGCGVASASSDGSTSENTSSLNPTSTFWGRSGENTGEEGSSTFTNYLTRSTEQDYTQVVATGGNVNAPSYSPRVSYGGDAPVDRGRSFGLAEGPPTGITQTPESKVASTSSTESTISPGRSLSSNKVSNQPDARNSYSNNSNSIESSAPSIVIPQTPPGNIESLIEKDDFFDKVVEIKPKEEVRSRTIEEKVEDVKDEVFNKYAAEREQLRKAHEERMANLRRKREDLFNQLSNARDERERLEAQDQLASLDEYIAGAKNSRSLPHHSAFGVNPQEQQRFSSKTNNDNNSSEAVGEGNPSRSIASVKAITPQQQNRMQQTRALLEKNGISAKSATGRAIASIEDSLSLSDLPRIIFDSKGRRRKFIPTDFVYTDGLHDVLVSTNQAGNEEIGIIEYSAKTKRLVFIIFKHPKSHHKNFKREVLALEKSGKFRQIDKIVNEYSIKRVISLPFNATRNKLQAIGYTYTEMFEMTIAGYDF